MTIAKKWERSHKILVKKVSTQISTRTRLRFYQESEWEMSDTQAHTKQTHTQIGAETVNPSHAEHTQAQIGFSPSTQVTPCSTQAISFFLAMENRENGE